jgi:putative hydrolase of the HAD superfamily
VFVGDNPREDITGAQHAGLRAIWRRSDEFPLGDAQPDAVIDALPEVPAIIAGW